MFQGHWIPDPEGPQYTNSSCRSLPKWMNCFSNGRQDRDFINWRWKPDKCDLPRFNPKTFLEFVKGKKLAFVGDSLARNHMESLLCLLSTVESPIYQSRGTADEDNKRWYFSIHDFTVILLRTKFLVFGNERVINGSSSSNIFDLHLDKLDESWTKDVQNADYIIFSSGHWFFRPIFLHNDGNLIGCVHCNEPNVTNHDPVGALRLAFRAALRHISSCSGCNAKVVLVRAFSPAHFEQGAWNGGGKCNRTSPGSSDEVGQLGGYEVEMRKAEVEEIENAKSVGSKMRFGIVDVTKAMLMRPDGHPGEFMGNRWHGYNDCLHWCLPGPIDVWNDFLNAVLREEAALATT